MSEPYIRNLHEFHAGHATAEASAAAFPISKRSWHSITIRADAENEGYIEVLSTGTSGFRLFGGDEVSLHVDHTDTIRIKGSEADQGFSYLVQ